MMETPGLPMDEIVIVTDKDTNIKEKMTWGEYLKKKADSPQLRLDWEEEAYKMPYEEFVEKVNDYAKEHYTWEDAVNHMVSVLSEEEKKIVLKALTAGKPTSPIQSELASALATAETASKENPADEDSLPDWWGATSFKPLPYIEYDPKAQADWIAQHEQEKERVTGDIPKHYQFECCGDAMVLIKEALGPEKFLGFCQGNILKYAVRANRKGLFYDNMDKIQRYAACAKDAVQDA